MFKYFLSMALLACSLALTSLAAHAQECSEKSSDCMEVGKWSVSVALGLGMRSNPVRDGDDLPVFLLPSISYYSERFFFETDTLGFTFVENENHMANVITTLSYDQMFFRDWSVGNFSLGPSGGASGFTPDSGGPVTSPDTGDPIVVPGTDDPDAIPDEGTPSSWDDRDVISGPAEDNTADEIFINTDDRKTALLGGFEYLYFHGPIDIQVQALRDISNVHDGIEIRVAGALKKQFSHQLYSVAVGGEWKDSANLDYYFGIDSHETNNESGEYNVGSAFSPFIKLQWKYRVNHHWHLQANWHYRHLSSAVTNSPLVVEDSVQTVFFGGVYEF